MFSLILCALVITVISQPTLTDYVLTPNGYFHKSCVFSLNTNDAKIVDKGNGQGAQIIHSDSSVQTIPPCSYPRVSFQEYNGVDPDSTNYARGWQHFASMQHPQNKTFTKFLSSFNVPGLPKYHSFFGKQTLFLFPGLQNIDWIPETLAPNGPFDIIQPVVQYGPSAAGEKSAWAVASWYVTLDHSSVFSSLVDVKPGDFIFGNMSLVSENEWFVGSLLPNNQHSNIQLARPRLAAQPWAYIVAEFYGTSRCSEFPSSDYITKDIQLFDADGPVVPVWKSRTGPDTMPCGSSLSITDNGKTVTIKFA